MGGLQLSENPRKSRKRSGDFNSSASGTKKHNTKKNSRNQSSDRNRKNNKQKTRGIGPRLPLGFKKELAEFIETRRKDEPHSDDDDSEDSPENDVPASDFIYEYDEPLPQEETKKNKRFDPVDNFEYELPEDFKDEEIDEDLADARDSDKEEQEQEQEEEEDDPTRHLSMLQRITGLPAEAFERKPRKKGPTAEGSETIKDTSDVNQFTKVTSMSMKELVDTLQGQPGYSRVRKMMEPFTKKQKLGQVGLQTAPLPKAIQAKLERTAAYKLIRDDVTKWEPLVKKNREASTLFFDDDNHVKVSTIEEMASGFKPRLDLEKKINSILEDAKIVEAYADDGAKILELNEVSVESVQDTLNKRAKMRSLLFHHEVKAKHIKKIKSKTYHRLQKKSRSKFALDDDEMDPEAAKEYAMKQEFKRAEERMTLKHKNSSKWAKRILKRGLQSQDAGTRAAITEQLQQHALLKRKMDTVKGSSSDESSDEDEGIEESGSDDDVPSKLVGKAKERTLGILNEEEEMPKSGLLSLPFMVRGMEKRKQVAYQEAELALKEYESLENSGDNGRAAGRQKSATSGKMVFGEIKSQRHEKSQFEHDGGQNSDSEGDEHEMNPKYNEAKELGKAAVIPKEHLADPTLLLDDLGIRYDPVFQDYVGLEKESDPRIAFDVSVCAPVSRTERKNERRAGNKEELNRKQEFDDEKIIRLHDLPDQDMKVEERSAESSNDSANGSESESESMLEYKMPSIEDVRKAAFAGDDVEEEFEKTKLEVLNEENPEPEAPALVPGWGQWTDVQIKKGLPSWMVAEYETAKKKREDALTRRKDAHLKDIIISEKVNKKAEKYYTKALPFPYKSKEAFEQTMRVPLGPDFNPSRAFRELNRPQVVKKAGVIINPIEFKELDSQDCPELKANDKKPKPKKNAGRKPTPKKFIQLANKK